jgi:hypothetical protein
MAHPGGTRRVRIVVVLARRPADLSEWLADGAAFDAAGADALWIEPDPPLDPLALTAALAAVTYRSLLVCAVSSPAPATAVSTVEMLSHGRLRLLAGDTGAVRRIDGDPAVYEYRHGPDGTQRWVAVPAPDGRTGWRTTLAEATEGGVDGVLVPADPRLIDILRNPDDPGQRLDLHLAQG